MEEEAAHKNSSIQILISNGLAKQYLCLNFDDKETIYSLKEKLSAKTGIEPNLMKVIFCGRQLEESINLFSLFLGPQT